MGGVTIYHAGDTGLFLDMKLIAEMNGPLAAALLPIGDNFTMGIDDAVKAAELLGAGVTLPMHYDTFDWIKVDAREFVRKCEAKGLKAAIVKPGARWTIA
jgi:L-ascorbate metabolism protein UlaG (beta-lactamase superfamily)